MRRAVLVLLAVLCMADDCDREGYNGTAGARCYGNLTCNNGLVCVVWKDGSDYKSVCAAAKDLSIGGVPFVKPQEKKPQASCPETHCPPPISYPKAPEGPCQECSPCEPEWKRSK